MSVFSCSSMCFVLLRIEMIDSVETHLVIRDIHTQFPSFEAVAAPILSSVIATNVAFPLRRTVLLALLQVV